LSVAIASVLDFILHIPYVLDACALPSILPSLSLTDMMYCTPEKKPTLVSVQVVASIFTLICISLPHNVVNRVRNRTARLRCVFGSTGGYGV